MKRKGTIKQLDVLKDLMLGGRHSRQTLARCGVTLVSADRWLKGLLIIPGLRSAKIGKTTWYEWRGRGRS